MEDRAEREQHRRSNRGVVWIVLGVAILVVMLVVGGGVGVLSKLFAGGDTGLSHRVLTALNGALGTDSTRFVTDRIHGTLFRGAILDRPRILVRTRNGEVTWASARIARVDYDLISLLFSSRRDLTVTLDSLRVTLARDSIGDLIMPKFRRGSGKQPKVDLRIRLALNDASLRFEKERISFDGLDGKGVVSTGRSGSTVLVENLEGKAHGASAESPVRLSGMIQFLESQWRLDPARVEFAKTRITGSGEWDSRHARLREGTVRLQPFVLEEMLPFFQVAGVHGVLRGDVDLAGVPNNANASGCLSGEIEGEKVDTVLVRARLVHDTVLVDRLETRLRGATVTGYGRVDSRGTVDARLQFRDANPADIPWWDEPEDMPKGDLAGTAHVQIVRGKPKPAVRIEGTLIPSRVGRADIDRASYLVHAPPLGGLILDSLTVDIPGSRIVGSGTVGPDGALRASATGSMADLGRMRKLLDPMKPHEGKGRVVVSLGGTTKAPTLDLKGVVAGARFENGLHGDSVVVVATGPLAPKLDLKGTLRVAKLGAKERILGDVNAQFAGGREMRIPRFEMGTGDTTLSMRGVLTFESGGIVGTVDSLRARRGSVHAVATEPVKVTYAQGRLHASPIGLDLEPGRVDADLDWNTSSNRIDLRGSITDLDLERVGSGTQRDSTRVLRGRLRAQFLLAGALSDPELTLRGSVSQPRWMGVAADSLTARLDYAPGVLTLETFRLAHGPSTAQITGTVRSHSPLEKWFHALETKDKSWAAGTTLALEASADSFRLASLASADTTLRTLAGDATFHARVGGSVGSPTIAMTGRIPAFYFRELGGDVSGLEGTYTNQKLEITSLELRQGKGVMNASGFIPIDLAPFAEKRLLREEPLHLTLKADGTSFASIGVLSPFIASSAGKLSGNAEVTGTPAHPKMTGAMQLRDGRIRFAGRYEVLDAVTIDGTFDEERLNLTKIEAREGKKGRLTGTGTWRWAGIGTRMPMGSFGPPGDYSLDLKASDCVVTDREYYLFQFSGTFHVVNARTYAGVIKPRITGSGTVSRGELAVNLATPVGEVPPPLPFLYEVTADFPRTFKYRQLDTEVDLAGSLRMRNEGDRDIVLGTLTVKGGQFYFLTRKFTDLTGEVDFRRVDKMEPFVTIDASTRIRRAGDSDEHIINLAITGYASQLQIRPWVDASASGPSSPSDLWRELSFGQFASSGGSLATGAGGVPLPIQGYAFRNAERWIESAGVFDTIDLQTGAGRATGTQATGVGGPIDLGTVGVGKYVTRDLFLKYSSDFTGQAEKQITAEYRMTRHLLLRGQQIQRTPSDPQTAAREFNLDLKVRVEY